MWQGCVDSWGRGVAVGAVLSGGGAVFSGPRLDDYYFILTVHRPISLPPPHTTHAAPPFLAFSPTHHQICRALAQVSTNILSLLFPFPFFSPSSLNAFATPSTYTYSFSPNTLSLLHTHIYKYTAANADAAPTSYAELEEMPTELPSSSALE